MITAWLFFMYSWLYPVIIFVTQTFDIFYAGIKSMAAKTFFICSRFIIFIIPFLY